MKLSRETWQKVEPLLAAGLEMAPAEREAWLAGLDATHSETAPLLRRMLATHERAEGARELETVPRLAPLPPWSSAYGPGAMIGPFELLRTLGRGGMGEVWLARQADGRVQREVALKLPLVGGQASSWRERFGRERDILAKLEHPHIARLYDAGVTPAGQPWLAMEYVAGVSLSEYVQARTLPVPERLALFRQVLSAVAHAHRRLVVHRDLKPANILIDAGGQARLLDFGIAKLVDDGEAGAPAGDLTRMGGRLMTLRYAAPEQVDGGAITTATDVYSLGVILHELLTGLSPYRAVREGRGLTDLMLLQEQPVLPSRLAIERRLARALAGDLDAIVLKALRRNPADRYASVERFDEDIAAHLDRRPVRARAGTWRYLAGRFVARRKLPMAMAAAVLLALVAGLVVAERERRVAVAEKARAERHLASVRKLANTFIYEVHAKIEKLPGSLEAREMVIRTSLEYLDALAAESGRDPALLFELASAYRAIAAIQGDNIAASRGNVPAALANLLKARDLLVELDRVRPNDIGALREHWRTRYALTVAYYQLTDPRWQAEIAAARQLAERIAAIPGASPGDRALAPFTEGRSFYLAMLGSGLTPASEAGLRAALARMEALHAEAPADAAVRQRLGTLYGNAGVGLSDAREGPSRMAEAIAYLEKAVVVARQLREESPVDMARVDTERLMVMNLVRRLAAEGELQRADALIREAAALVEETAARHPDDMTTAVARLWILVGAADVSNRLGDYPRAIRVCRDVLASAARLPPETAAQREVRITVPEARVILGYALLETAQSPKLDRAQRVALLLEARALFAQVAEFVDEVRGNEVLGAIPEYKLREFAQARKRLERALREVGAI